MENCKTCEHEAEVHDEDGCNRFRRGALYGCHCRKFVSPTIEAIKGLSGGDQIRLVCIHQFGFDPKLINLDEAVAIRSNDFVGIRLVCYFPTGEDPWKWVEDHLPKDKFPGVKFLRQEIIDFVSSRSRI